MGDQKVFLRLDCTGDKLFERLFIHGLSMWVSSSKKKQRMGDSFNQIAVQAIVDHLQAGSRLLEIGMGHGKEIGRLQEKFHVTGSDISQAFINMYQEIDPEADLLKLDAITLETDRKFDCIYSNKLLHLLPQDRLRDSFCRQYEILSPGGILCHTLWYGDKKIEVKGQWIYYYTEKTLKDYLNDYFEILLAMPYMEILRDDSLLLILKKV